MKAEEWKRIMKEEAERIGMEQGIKQGMKQGIEQGKEIGECSKLKSVVSAMWRKGFKTSEIIDILEEDAGVIEKIVEQL